MRGEKRSVRQFYEEFGWDRAEGEPYRDTQAFVDLRPVVGNYLKRCMARLAAALPKQGRFFLDAGCGAIASPEYATLSGDFDARVCVDFSRTALLRARETLGGQAVYVQADITQLPFRDGTFGAALCAHVIYHVPADEQERAFLELHRTLAPGAVAAVVYVWPFCLLRTLAIKLNPRVVLPKVPGMRLIWRAFFKPHVTAAETAPVRAEDLPPLYFHPHPYSWYRKTIVEVLPVELRCWAAADLPFTQAFVPNRRVGACMLQIMSWLEDWFPHTMGRIGAYPLMLIRKAERSAGGI